ncbi:LuxR C-terminal-related transcriptional regulator [Amycolatopsis sp. GM8]|uniref:LuxR C-terminal-related transcriptional regulator n=1 Tax=Amycolatopsis sp. GM8 TaxID=2896530 RepID=UPI001F00002F|nr:LuxR C-terminal-related transcriptional regulator [Amycolatopsis sp. GM8]
MKLVPPCLPQYYVARPGLLDRLIRGVESTDVMLLSAPAGYGKTLLLADWIAATGTADKAWVAVDSGDQGADRFLATLLYAIREHTGARAMAPSAGDDAETLLAALIDTIDALPDRLFLILDDVQELLGGQATDVLAALIRHQPRNLHIVLAARTDPLLPLARLRVAGRLAELRSAELRFLPSEVPAVLRTAGVELTDEQVHNLAELTEGWIAGLRLAARSLYRIPDPGGVIEEYLSNDRTITDFLAGEVLPDLPPQGRRLLRLLSVCETVTAELAGALAGDSKAGDVLAELERESSLVAAFGEDRRWYRIHPLLRSYLNADLRRTDPQLVHGLHRFLARWFAAEGQPTEALRYARLTGDGAAVAEFLHDKAIELLVLGEPQLVLDGLSAAGGEIVSRDPWLLLFSALAHLEKGDLVTSERDLARCGGIWPDRPEPVLAQVRRLVHSAQALASGRGALAPASEFAEPPDDVPWLVAWTALDRGVSLTFAGRHAEGVAELERAQEVCRFEGLDFLLLHTRLALAFAAAGHDLPAMERICTGAMELANEGGWRHSPFLAAGHAMLGMARLARLDPVGATESVRRIGNDAPAGLRFTARMVAGTALFDRGDPAASLARLHAARHELGDQPVMPWLIATAALLEHQCALSLGQFPLAAEVATWAGLRLGDTPELRLMAARARLAGGEYAEALAIVRAFSDTHIPPAVSVTNVEVRLIEAAVALATGRRTQGREALAAALALARPGGLIRPFGYAEPSVRSLLADQIGGFADCDAFASQVRRRLVTFDGRRADEMLTGRERAVLIRLTSPDPLDEVASDLSISINTVKTHVRAIYAKLGVNSRRAAVVAARERGLN